MTVWILIGALIAVVALTAYAHSSLEAFHRRMKAAWVHLDRQLHERHDLIPRLIEAASARRMAPTGPLQELAAARQAALDAHGVSARYEAENRVTETLRSFFAVADADGGLRGDAVLLSLEAALTAAEQEIAAARDSYNDRVMALNVRRHRFPWRLMAVRFTPGEYFIIDEPAHR